MSDEVKLVKSDREQIIDLATTLVGLAILIYTLNPEPFDELAERIKARFHGWLHRVSIWEARQAIRSLPEIDPS